MASIGQRLTNGQRTPELARATHLAKNDYLLILDLVQLRKEAGLTQGEVAERMGLSQQAVSKIESYHGDPKLSTLRRYAHAIGALVAHNVEADEGQLFEPAGFVFKRIVRDAVTVRSAASPALVRVPAPISAKADFALIA